MTTHQTIVSLPKLVLTDHERDMHTTIGGTIT